MIAILQRVTEASVEINKEIKSSIENGLFVLIGIVSTDTNEDIEWVVKKIIQMRIFGDQEGKMNLSLKDIDGELLIVSQFTLLASTKKGNRPSFIDAASPETSIPLYEKFLSACEKELGKEIKSGEFGADMKVRLLNDGPVTISIDSKEKK